MRYFGGGREHIYKVFVFRALCELENVKQLRRVFVKIVYHICVIPEYAEILCGGLERGKAADNLVAVNGARGV